MGNIKGASALQVYTSASLYDDGMLAEHAMTEASKVPLHKSLSTEALGRLSSPQLLKLVSILPDDQYTVRPNKADIGEYASGSGTFSIYWAHVRPSSCAGKGSQSACKTRWGSTPRQGYGED
jgi:hypothetical protein